MPHFGAYGPIPDYDHDKIDERCHIPVKCTDKYCNGCMFCAGGLYGCSVCGGLEGAMPSQCPGRRMTEEEIEKCYQGELDFNYSKWWIPNGS